jgi:hypothetical protein
LNWPGSQGRQKEAADCDDALPASHKVQTVRPVVLAKVLQDKDDESSQAVCKR